MMTHSYNLISWEAVARGLQVQAHSNKTGMMLPPKQACGPVELNRETIATWVSAKVPNTFVGNKYSLVNKCWEELDTHVWETEMISLSFDMKTFLRGYKT